MATVSSTSSCNLLGCQLKKSSSVCLMLNKFGSSSKMNSSLGLCQTLRGMLGYHTKTFSRTFLEIHLQVITQKLFRNYWRSTTCLVATWELNYMICNAILPAFRKILVLLTTSKMIDFTKIWCLWKNVITVDGMYIWWLTIAGASNEIVLKLNTAERSINFYVNYLRTIIITAAISFVKA